MASRTSVRFDFDPRKLIEGLTSREVREAIVVVAVNEIDDALRETAARRLSKKRAEIYTDAIQVGVFRGTSASIVFEGEAANAIEYGNSWDMKPGLLKGESSRVIRFQHSAYRSKGAKAPPMGAPYRKKLGEQAAYELGRRVYDQVSRLPDDVPLRRSGTQKLKDIHKRPIYDGIRRERKGAGIQNVQYATYRTVSINSPADSWIYPARPPENLIEAALEIAEERIQEQFGEVLDGLAIRLKTAKRGGSGK